MRYVAQEELQRELEPVRSHFTSKNLSAWTVLAAYLRSRGLEPSGDTWEYAVAAFDAGWGFAEVADDCHRRFGQEAFNPSASDNKMEDLGNLRDGNESQSVESALNPEDLAVSGVDTSNVRVSTSVEEEERPNDNDDLSSGDEIPTSFGIVESPALTANRQDLPNLEWFPKVQTEGTIQAEGIRKLLGAREQDDLAILIRETAQNSWDARRPDSQPQFRVVVRSLAEEQRELLKRNVFSGREAGGSGVRDPLSAVLRKKSIRVIEIHDRGTKGLSGPVRNDVVYEGNDPEDFANLILRIGAPKSDATAGGTYGFGKEAAYGISENRTVIYWTKCVSEGETQHRFIGVTLGDPFVIDDLNYTGQQWWGQVIDGERVEPIVGEEARALGESLFGESFGAEYGTSIMILEPNLSGLGEKAVSNRLAAIVRDDLWPKLIPMPNGTVPMKIDVEVDGTKIELTDKEAGSDRTRQTLCLEAVRAVQQGLPNPHDLDVRVIELVRKRPHTVLGHLGISVWPKGQEHLDGDDSKASTICLMRHDAELVVKYEQHRGSSNPTMAWTGVFKPVAETDEAFAKAEPPAHDDWKIGQIKNSDFKGIVRVAETRRNETVLEVLEPFERRKQVGGEEITSQLSKSLGWLAPSVAEVEEAPKREPRTRVGARRSRRSTGSEFKVDVQDYRLIPSSTNDRITAQITIVVHGDAKGVAVRPVIQAQGEDKKETLTPGELDLRWPLGVREDEQGRALLVANEAVVVEVDFYEGLVLDLGFDVEGIS